MSSVVLPAPVTVDAKERAGDSFAAVLRRTRKLFPDPTYHPQEDATGTRLYFGPHSLSVNSDGTGTKPELVERLYAATGATHYFERPAHDVVAMVADDAARHGQFTLGIVNCVDVSSAENHDFVAALARGLEQACRAGRFPLINGETAELGYRVPGPGDSRLNWNAVALALVHADKVYRASNLRPGQPLVALRERTIRSNGLSKARAILEQAWLAEQGLTRDDWLAQTVARLSGGSLDDARRHWATLRGEQPWLAEHVVVPWHVRFAELTERLSRPATIYSPVIYEAQGGVDGPVSVPLVAAAHITGGGVPLKVKRMLARTGLGAALTPVFPDPEGIPELLELAASHPLDGYPLVDDRSACEQWNRGIGFVCVAPDAAVARALIDLATSLGFEAAEAGHILPVPEIHWRGHVWSHIAT